MTNTKRQPPITMTLATQRRHFCAKPISGKVSE